MWDKVTYSERVREVERIIESGEIEDWNIESLGTYLLESPDIKAKKDDNYIICRSENEFKRRIEIDLDSNIILDLKSFGKRYIIPKKQNITWEDTLQDWAIRDYEHFINACNDTETHKFGREVRYDQKLCKDQLLGTIYFKHVGMGSCDTDWDRFDYKNKKHVEAGLKYGGSNLDKWLGCIKCDLDRAINMCDFSERQREVLDLWRSDWRIRKSEIAEILGITRNTVGEYLDIVIDKIIRCFPS